MRIEFGRTALEFHPTEQVDEKLVDRLFKLEERRVDRIVQREATAEARTESVNKSVLALIQQFAPYLEKLFRRSPITVTQEDTVSAEDDRSDA